MKSNVPKPDVRDNLDSRKNEEFEINKGKVTHNERAHHHENKKKLKAGRPFFILWLIDCTLYVWQQTLLQLPVLLMMACVNLVLVKAGFKPTLLTSQPNEEVQRS